MISVENVRISYGPKTVFKDLNTTFEEKKRQF